MPLKAPSRALLLNRLLPNVTREPSASRRAGVTMLTMLELLTDTVLAAPAPIPYELFATRLPSMLSDAPPPFAQKPMTTLPDAVLRRTNTIPAPSSRNPYEKLSTRRVPSITVRPGGDETSMPYNRLA